MFDDTVGQDTFSSLQQPSAMLSVGRVSGDLFSPDKTFETSPQCFWRVFFNAETDHVHE